MSPLPIETLIKSRASELGLTLAQVVSRTGMANTSKGLRGMEQLLVYIQYFLSRLITKTDGHDLRNHHLHPEYCVIKQIPYMIRFEGCVLYSDRGVKTYEPYCLLLNCLMCIF